jgi:hypothetical protein
MHTGAGDAPAEASSKVRVLAIALILLAPATAHFAFHYVHGFARGLFPTGFTQYDQAFYMACARQFIDGKAVLTYANPASPDLASPNIYFSPVFVALGAIWSVTKLDPGLILTSFGLVAGAFAIVVASRIFRRLFGLEGPARKLTFLCFLWGGGVYAFAGALAMLVRHDPISKLFRFDPGGGWWFMNFGRNLIYPMEAYYHLLVLGMFLAFVQRKRALALGLLALLSMSHAFAGAQFVGVVVTWLALERFVVRDRSIRFGHLAGAAAIAVYHVGYYLVYLPSDPEHRKVMDFWTLPWTLSFGEWLLGMVFVLPLVAWQLRSKRHVIECFSDPSRRLLAVWFFVSLALENHDLFMKPHQPLHFTRGHDWTALFLLGAPTLIALFEYLGARLARGLAVFATTLVVGLFLTDNALWMAAHYWVPQGIYLDPTQRRVIAWLNANAPRNAIVVTDDNHLAYAVTIYTPNRTWFSHWATTPAAVERSTEVKRYFSEGVEPSSWRGRNLIFVDKGTVRASLREYGGVVAER